MCLLCARSLARPPSILASTDRASFLSVVDGPFARSLARSLSPRLSASLFRRRLRCLAFERGPPTATATASLARRLHRGWRRTTAKKFCLLRANPKQRRFCGDVAEEKSAKDSLFLSLLSNFLSHRASQSSFRQSNPRGGEKRRGGRRGLAPPFELRPRFMAWGGSERGESGRPRFRSIWHVGKRERRGRTERQTLPSLPLSFQACYACVRVSSRV